MIFLYVWLARVEVYLSLNGPFDLLFLICLFFISSVSLTGSYAENEPYLSLS